MPIRHPRRPDFSAPAFPMAPQSRLYRNIAIGFLALTGVIVIFALWISTTHVRVVIKAKQEATSVDTFVDVAKSPEIGQLQGRVVEGVFDNIQEFKTKDHPVASAPSGVASVATTTGRVRIVNRYSSDQALVKTTRLLTADGKLFRINATVHVPSGQSLEVAAYSDQPGPQFQIHSGTKLTIPGLWVDLQKWIYAEAISDFSGTAGSIAPSESGQAVSSEDVTDAYVALSDVVLENAKKTSLTEAGIAPEKIQRDCQDACWEAVYLVTPVEKKTNVSIGQRADSFLAQVKLKVVAVYYPRKDMQTLIRSKMKERIPEGRDVVGLDADAVTYRIQQADASSQKARIALSARAVSRISATNTSIAPEQIFGMSIDAARARLLSVDGVQSVQIFSQPSWASKVPSQKSKIEVVVE